MGLFGIQLSDGGGGLSNRAQAMVSSSVGRLQVSEPFYVTQDVSGMALPFVLGLDIDTESWDWLQIVPGLIVWAGTVENANLGARIYNTRIGIGNNVFTSSYRRGAQPYYSQPLSQPIIVPWRRGAQIVIEIYGSMASVPAGPGNLMELTTVGWSEQ